MKNNAMDRLLLNNKSRDMHCLSGFLYCVHSTGVYLGRNHLKQMDYMCFTFIICSPALLACWICIVTFAPTVCSLCLQLHNDEKKSSGASSRRGGLPSFSLNCFLVDNDRAESRGCHRLILPREEQEAKGKYKKQHDWKHNLGKCVFSFLSRCGRIIFYSWWLQDT